MTILTTVPAFVPGNEGEFISLHLTSPATECSNGSPVYPDGGTSVADATTSEKICGMQDSHRPDGDDGRRTAQGSRKKVLVWQIPVVVLILGVVGTVVYLWQTVSQQSILLTSLDTAFRSGRLDSLPQRIHELEDKHQQYQSSAQAQTWHEEDVLARESLNMQLTQLTKNSELLRSDVMVLTVQQEALQQLTDAVLSRLTEQVSRIDVLSAWKTQWEGKVAGTAAKPLLVRMKREPAVVPPALKKPVVSHVLLPPFVLSSVERRGGQSYALVLPVGAGNDWSQLQMLSPGDSYRGWRLVGTDGHRAEFYVNGHTRQLTP
ncbi:hypothetical protein DP590_07250 [Salmonella enterica]|nr:hypothetical protein [Salmonella enterica]ECE0739797.1 hypothetical protein [Salmonella enterica subsp. enterica serovar Hvittingfoss]EGA8119657.1 hypothetical protein [Salmonella enterica]EHO8673575.1 hypothetical protein [Salmonella enterica]HEC8060728.1 hypothetical protein [Salmonella enterica subsp. enterica serovar Potsdam]